MRRIACGFILLISVTAQAQVNDLSRLLEERTKKRKAAGTTLSADTAGDCDEAKAALEEGGEEASASKLPLSYFGVGIGALNNIGDDDRVSDAQLVDGKVTILADDNLMAGPVFEAHALILTTTKLWALPSESGRFFVTDTPAPCHATAEFPMIAHGPFVVTRVGDNEIVKSLGVGWMMGFRMQQSNTSLNIGLAYSFELNAKTLAKGFEEGSEHAAGTTILYRTTRGSALGLVVSFGF